MNKGKDYLPIPSVKHTKNPVNKDMVHTDAARYAANEYNRTGWINYTNQPINQSTMTFINGSQQRLNTDHYHLHHIE
jgi:hypothetical protein